MWNSKGSQQILEISIRWEAAFPSSSSKRNNIEQAWQGLSLLIKKGQRVAVVGESGSGKSTVMALLERFYDPSSGVVTINSVDIKTFAVKSLRRRVGYVGQEPVLFATSIKDNILQGSAAVLKGSGRSLTCNRLTCELPLDPDKCQCWVEATERSSGLVCRWTYLCFNEVVFDTVPCSLDTVQFLVIRSHAEMHYLCWQGGLRRLAVLGRSKATHCHSACID
eukprot:1166668-Amphidinium_carterae.1